VRDGFLEKETLESLIENWYKMLQHPDHAIFRQLFIVNGEKEAADVTDYHNSKAEELTDNSGRTQIPGNLKELTSTQQESTLVIYFIKRISEIMEQPDLDPEPGIKLNDIDIDSIAAAELSSLLKSDFNTVVSIADILQKFSINDIVRAILNNPDSFKSGTSVRELPGSDNKWLEGEL
jgi:acyl carrier protein